MGPWQSQVHTCTGVILNYSLKQIFFPSLGQDSQGWVHEVDFLCNEEHVIGSSLCTGDQKMWQKGSMEVLVSASSWRAFPRAAADAAPPVGSIPGVWRSRHGIGFQSAGIGFLELLGLGAGSEPCWVCLGSQSTPRDPQHTPYWPLGSAGFFGLLLPSVWWEMTLHSALQTWASSWSSNFCLEMGVFWNPPAAGPVGASVPFPALLSDLISVERKNLLQCSAGEKAAEFLTWKYNFFFAVQGWAKCQCWI